MKRCIQACVCLLILNLFPAAEAAGMGSMRSMPGWLLGSQRTALGPWESAFSQDGATDPESLSWRSAGVPGSVDTAAGAVEGYSWLRAQLPAGGGGEGRALVLGPTGHSVRVFVDGVASGGDAAAGGAFVSRLGLYRCFPLPAGTEVMLRLYHRGGSWVEAGVWLLPSEEARFRTLILNLVFLFSRTMLVALFLFFFLRALFVYFLETSAAMLYLAFLPAVALLNSLCATFLPLLAPLPTALRVMPVLQMSTAVMLALYCLSVLQVRRTVTILALAVPMFLGGWLGLAFTDFEMLLTVRSIQWAVLFAGLTVVLLLALASLRQKPGQALPLAVFLLFLLASLCFQVLRRSPRPAQLRSDTLLDTILVLFLIWITLTDMRKRSRLSARTTRELVERVEEDWELILRLKSGQERLQRRNLDSMHLSSRLMESSQKQALTMAQIMKAIEEATDAGQQVVRKEKDILERTREVDARIIDFNLQISKALEALEELQEKSRTITRAVGQIIGIAEKTNILALNASIEASKAGEAGRGFSALASQTRKLADVTRTVSDQINGLIEESNRAIRQDVDTVKSLGRGFKDIMRQSEDIRTMIEQNALAFEEVSQANLDIKDGVAGVDRTIRTILEVSRDLREMTGRLADAFGWFDELLRAEQQPAPEAETPPGDSPLPGAGQDRAAVTNHEPAAPVRAERFSSLPGEPHKPEDYAELEELEEIVEAENAGEDVPGVGLS
jgi:hypothetical protein